MLKKILWLCLTTTLAFSACGTLNVTVDRNPAPVPSALQVSPTGIPTAGIQQEPTFTLPDQSLNMDSSSDAIRARMLNSALNWKTIWMDGLVYQSMDSNGHPQDGIRQQVWIDQAAARFRFLSGPENGAATHFKVSDGSSILDMDLVSGATQMSAMPQGIAGQFVSHPAAGIGSPNPLWGQIGEPLAEMAFSSDFAQNDGTYQPVAIEMVAGRQALVMDWTYIQNSLPSWRLWLDVHTAVILKEQDFDKSGGSTVLREYIVSTVQYDIPNLPEALFSVTPASPPVFSEVSGDPLVSTTPGPSAPAGSDPLGDVYFFLMMPGDDANGARLVRLPGSCVAGKQACPAVEQVVLPGLTFANNGPVMAWSPDNKMAAYVANTADGPARLFVSAMPAPVWKQVAAFVSIDLPAWSGDGSWISFRVHDLQGGQDDYVVHPDGSGLKNVTATASLPAADRPYNVDGWISNYLIVHSGNPDKAAKVYLVRADDGIVKTLFDSALSKVEYYPSPDGSLLAFEAYDNTNNMNTLRIVAPDGSGLRDLASFKTTIWPISWSPDASSLAFAVYGNQAPPQADVYVINRDGRGLKQVYGSAQVQNLAFSPNGQFLLAETGNPGGLLMVDLSSLQTLLLQAPGMSLTDWWRQPAWVR
ncbi:MAG TPA: hypothetical protein VMT91_14440 [Anaerolineales bacterium]|nr:hypothetical protein [Anaerolineales bacterium]